MSTSTPTFVSEHEAIITASVNGISFPAYLKKWRTFQGGDPTGNTSQFFPGGTDKSIAIPGPVSRTQVTITAGYTTAVHNGIRAQLDNSINKRMSASYTPTDADGNPNGRTITRTGILHEVQWPQGTSDSGKVAEFGLVMECDGA